MDKEIVTDYGNLYQAYRLASLARNLIAALQDFLMSL